VDDFLRDVALASHRIDGDDRTFDDHHVQQLRDRDDLVGLLRHLDLAEYEALARREGVTISIGALAPLPWYDRREVLPSTAITPSGTPVSEATQETKHRWKCAASRVAKISPR
ncbi:MAG TPA: hypothetical protein VJY15_08515, partial [Candidatus Acidoferrum sp.]|nr:hypothetical protein [Candidatus Acidoferrum sp.]